MVDGLPVTTVARTVADLAAARVDGGHLAAVVRDALTVKHVSDHVLGAALAPHAQQYGSPAGDGTAVLARFLQESGLAVPLTRAVELAGADNPGPNWATGYSATARSSRIAPEFHGLPAALRLVGECLNPILAGDRRSGSWQPGSGWSV